MTGNLDMGDHSIQKVGGPVNSDDVATKNYVDAEIGYISTPFLKLNGTRAMTGVLNMNDHKISNLKMPEFNTDAANKQYINEALLKSHLVSSEVENSFKYLSDQDESSSEKNIIVNGIQDFNGSPHKNKKAYSIDLVHTPGTQNYDSKIGINLYSLPIGKYTIIMEYYFPEDINISLVAESSTAVINKQVTTSFSDHKKQLVQFDQRSKNTPDYLFFNIRGGATTSTNPEGYLVFYGVKEWVDSVPPEIYDHALETGMFEYDNGNMKMYHDIDMNNHKIINIAPPTNPTDLLMKKSLEIHDIFIFGFVNNIRFLTSNNSNLKIKNMYIKKLIFYGGSKYANTQDGLLVNAGLGGPLWRYSFRFGPSNQATEINLDRYFNTTMNNFRLITANQIEFELLYSPLTIKTT